jgi:hypothetical protein
MIIDIEKIISQCPVYDLQSNYVARKITSTILQQANINNKFKVVVGWRVFDWINFGANYIDENYEVTNYLEHIGILMHIGVYRDRLNIVKPNEIILFDKISELDYLKNYMREQKIKRVLEMK